ncbi:MAG TPA: hypothetical protein VFP72_22340, partial [Kineosporiaceae bacterium]|nr:hypothetical protein [Kineosporiaceae bacterium]
SRVPADGTVADGTVAAAAPEGRAQHEQAQPAAGAPTSVAPAGVTRSVPLADVVAQTGLLLRIPATVSGALGDRVGQVLQVLPEGDAVFQSRVATLAAVDALLAGVDGAPLSEGERASLSRAAAALSEAVGDTLVDLIDRPADPVQETAGDPIAQMLQRAMAARQTIQEEGPRAESLVQAVAPALDQLRGRGVPREIAGELASALRRAVLDGVVADVLPPSQAQARQQARERLDGTWSRPLPPSRRDTGVLVERLQRNVAALREQADSLPQQADPAPSAEGSDAASSMFELTFAPPSPASASSSLTFTPQSPTFELTTALLGGSKEAGPSVTDAPVAEVQAVDAPVVEAPVAEGPVADGPVVDVPVADVPVAEGPVADVPVVDVPVVDVPVADVPVADVPVAVGTQAGPASPALQTPLVELIDRMTAPFDPIQALRRIQPYTTRMLERSLTPELPADPAGPARTGIWALPADLIAAEILPRLGRAEVSSRRAEQLRAAIEGPIAQLSPAQTSPVAIIRNGISSALEEILWQAGVESRAGDAPAPQLSPRVRQLLEELQIELSVDPEVVDNRRLEELQLQLRDALQWVPEAAQAVQRVRTVRDLYRAPLREMLEEAQRAESEWRSQLPAEERSTAWMGAPAQQTIMAERLYDAVDGVGSDLGWGLAESRAALARVGVFNNGNTVLGEWGQRTRAPFTAGLLQFGYFFPEEAQSGTEQSDSSPAQSPGPVGRTDTEVGEPSRPTRTLLDPSDSESEGYRSDGEFGALAERWARLDGEDPVAARQATEALTGTMPVAGTSDAGTSDPGTSDAGISDPGTSDAGISDAGTSDAGISDAGTSDSGASTVEAPAGERSRQPEWPTLAAAVEATGLGSGLPERLVEPLRNAAELSLGENLSALQWESVLTHPVAAALLTHRELSAMETEVRQSLPLPGELRPLSRPDRAAVLADLASAREAVRGELAGQLRLIGEDLVAPRVGWYPQLPMDVVQQYAGIRDVVATVQGLALPPALEGSLLDQLGPVLQDTVTRAMPGADEVARVRAEAELNGRWRRFVADPGQTAVVETAFDLLGALGRHAARQQDSLTAAVTMPQVRGTELAALGDLAADAAGLGLREIRTSRGLWDAQRPVEAAPVAQAAPVVEAAPAAQAAPAADATVADATVADATVADATEAVPAGRRPRWSTLGKAVAARGFGAGLPLSLGADVREAVEGFLAEGLTPVQWESLLTDPVTARLLAHRELTALEREITAREDELSQASRRPAARPSEPAHAMLVDRIALVRGDLAEQLRQTGAGLVDGTTQAVRFPQLPLSVVQRYAGTDRIVSTIRDLALPVTHEAALLHELGRVVNEEAVATVLRGESRAVREGAVEELGTRWQRFVTDLGSSPVLDRASDLIGALARGVEGRQAQGDLPGSQPRRVRFAPVTDGDLLAFDVPVSPAVSEVGQFAPAAVVRAPWYQRVGAAFLRAGALWRAESRPVEGRPAEGRLTESLPAQDRPAEVRLARLAPAMGLRERIPASVAGEVQARVRESLAGAPQGALQRLGLRRGNVFETQVAVVEALQQAASDPAGRLSPAERAALERATAAASAQVYRRLVTFGQERTRADRSEALFTDFVADPAREIVDDTPLRGDAWDLFDDLAGRRPGVRGPGAVPGVAPGTSAGGQQSAGRPGPAGPTVRGLPPQVGHALEGMAPAMLRMVGRGVLGGDQLRLLAGLREAVVAHLVPAALPGAPIEVVQAVQDEVAAHWDSAARGTLAPRDPQNADSFDGIRGMPLRLAVNWLGDGPDSAREAMTTIDEFVGALSMPLTESLGHRVPPAFDEVARELLTRPEAVSEQLGMGTGEVLDPRPAAADAAARLAGSGEVAQELQALAADVFGPQPWGSGDFASWEPGDPVRGWAGELLPGLAALTAAGTVLDGTSGVRPGAADRAALVDGAAGLR